MIEATRDSPVLSIGLEAAFSKIHGPGSRFVIWVQGCSRHCAGCANKDLWSFDAGKKRAVSEIVEEIRATPGIEGITITGGEPLDQVEPVLSLMRRIKDIGLTVVLYTGYELVEIDADSRKKATFELADIAIVGRFEAENRASHLRWRGSANKKFIFHNAEYEKLVGTLDDLNEVEIYINDDGEMIISGYPDENMRRMFKNAKILPR